MCADVFAIVSLPKSLHCVSDASIAVGSKVTCIVVKEIVVGSSVGSDNKSNVSDLQKELNVAQRRR
jgi:hypothetical protein